jgi:hypothetical protein
VRSTPYYPAILFVAALTACGPGAADPSITSLPGETERPTASTTATFQPTPSFTPTITFTPSPTPLAGADGLLVYCEGAGEGLAGWYTYDLGSQVLSAESLESSYANREQARQTSIQLLLHAQGVPDELLDDLSIPSSMLDPCCLQILAVSSAKDAVLFEREGTPAELIWLDLRTQEFSTIYSGEFDVENSDRSVKFLESTSEVFFHNYVEGEIFAVNLSDGSLTNLTAGQEEPARYFGVSSDGERIAYIANRQVWLYDRRSDSHDQLLDLPAFYVDWHPSQNQVVVESLDQVLLLDPTTGEAVDVADLMGDYDFISTPHWSPDGSLAFWLRAGDIWAPAIVDLETGERQIFSGLPTADLVDTRFVDQFTWSPDGRWFLAWIVNLPYYGQLFVCDRETGTCLGLDASPPSDDDYCRANLKSWVE